MGGARLSLSAPPPAWDPASAEAQAPAGRPRLPLWGGSFHLVTTQKCVAAAPPCPRVCLWGLFLAREGAKRLRKGLHLSPGKGQRKRRADPLLAVLVPVISLFFFQERGFKLSSPCMLGQHSTTELDLWLYFPFLSGPVPDKINNLPTRSQQLHFKTSLFH